MPSCHVYPIKEVCAALERSKGIKSIAAKLIGCSVSTLDNYAKQFPEVAETIAEQRAQLVGMATLGLIHHVKAKDLRACMFVLETLGRTEGWARRQELTGPDGGPMAVTAVTFTIVHPEGHPEGHSDGHSEGHTNGTTADGHSGTPAQPLLNGKDHREPGRDPEQQDV